jgi:hypothetical protein
LGRLSRGPAIFLIFSEGDIYLSLKISQYSSMYIANIIQPGANSPNIQRVSKVSFGLHKEAFKKLRQITFESV